MIRPSNNDVEFMQWGLERMVEINIRKEGKPIHERYDEDTAEMTEIP